MARVDITDLKNLDNVEKLADIFTHRLNYDYQASALSIRRWREDIANSIVNSDIKLLAKRESFHIIYCKIENLLLGIERSIVNQLLKEHPYLLVIFSDKSCQNWHFVNIKYDEEIKNRRLFRRIVIGPDERLHTAAERINKLEITDERIGPLEVQKNHDEAFDVEEVTKEFYEKFSDIFHTLAEDIVEENPQLDTAKEAQIILNRLIFLYFIQKKGWLNNNKRYLYENFLRYWKKDSHGDSFYSDFLSKLFQALSCPGDLYKNILGDVPFLNGGLFEVNPFPINPKLQPRLVIKNSTFKRIFDDLLEHFNFTVREDTPLDVEVAIDPEMLGKIFENLVLKLEKGEDLRKKTGSYYTPRVIVHFMCQESLKEYLVTESEIERPKIELLFKMNPADQLTEEEIKSLEDSFTLPQARLLKNLIKKTYILDPAVGSGAFLVGILHEMVSVIKLLDIREYGKDYIQKTNYDYELKRQLIETSLYGVDIQEQAVRICELRLWLSLIVDYEKVKGEEIPPLPNLSYRIRCGDSLIEKLFGHNVQLDQLVQTVKGKQLIDEITTNKEGYFLARDIREKNRIELSTLAKQCELMELLIKEKQKSLGFQPSLFEETAKERQKREEFEKTKREYEEVLLLASNTKKKIEAMLRGKISIPAEAIHDLKQRLGISFIWKLDFAEVFKEKSGFDVVIGNPPWITMRGKQRMGITQSEVEYYKKVYINSAEYKINSFAIFTEKSIHLLRLKGIFSFIMPNTILRNQYLSRIRKYILESAELRFILDLGGSVFQESVADSAVLIFIKAKVPNLTQLLKAYYHIENLEKHNYKSAIFKAKDFLSSQGYEYNIYVDNVNVALIRKIEDGSCPFKQYLKNYVGIITGDNKKYISRTKINEKYKKILVGEDIKKYRYQFNSKYVLFDKDILWSNTDERIFMKSEKILLRKTGSTLIAAYDNKKFFTEQTVYNLYFKESVQYDLKYFLALLNSRLMQYYFSKKLITNPDSYPYIKGIHIDVLPAKEINFGNPREKDSHGYIIKLVEELIGYYEQYKECLPNEIVTRVKELEHQINQKVYELYGLTEEEIGLVEKSIKA